MTIRLELTKLRISTSLSSCCSSTYPPSQCLLDVISGPGLYKYNLRTELSPNMQHNHQTNEEQGTSQDSGGTYFKSGRVVSVKF
mmetsp:Transcript_31802/g.59143  ORF Transcript_31802/g.59143 Transcript_31802/m.59143 type:complete len:84 (-) Transcript_31802:178-429(-)